MAFDRLRFEAFAMLIEQVSQQHTAGTPLDVDVIGQSMGLCKEDSREIANYMIETGLAEDATPTGAASVFGKMGIRLTIKGYSEIAKLRRHRLVLLWDNHRADIAIVISLLALACSLVKLFF